MIKLSWHLDMCNPTNSEVTRHHPSIQTADTNFAITSYASSQAKVFFFYRSGRFTILGQMSLQRHSIISTYLSSSVYSVFNVDAAAVKVQVLNGLGLTCVSFPIADTVTCYARIGFRFGAILTPAERIERCRLTVWTVRFLTWCFRTFITLAAFHCRTCAASCTLSLCKGRCAFSVPLQHAFHFSSGQSSEAKHRASSTDSLHCLIVGKQVAAWCATSLPNCMIWSFNRRVLWCSAWFVLDHALISACSASFEEVPLGNKALWAGVMACRTRRLLNNHSIRSGAAAAHRIFRTSLLVPVTLRLTSLGKQVQMAASVSTNAIRERSGVFASNASRMRLALAWLMLPSNFFCRACSSSLLRAAGLKPEKNGPQESMLLDRPCWPHFFRRCLSTLEPADFLPHWAYSYTMARCTGSNEMHWRCLQTALIFRNSFKDGLSLATNFTWARAMGERWLVNVAATLLASSCEMGTMPTTAPVRHSLKRTLCF